MKWLPLLLCAGCVLSTTEDVDMPDALIARPIGRVSEPSHTQAPPGSLLRAHNCVLREPGVLSPRPDETTMDTRVGARVVRMSDQFDNGGLPANLAVVRDGSLYELTTTEDLATEITYDAPDGTNTSIRLDRTDENGFDITHPFYQARDNLYLSDAVGVYKWESTDDSQVTRVWDGSNTFAVGDVETGTGAWLSNGNHVRYATVAVYEDANGVVRRSAPVLSAPIENGDGADRYIGLTVTVLLDEFDRPGFRSVEVYRTRQYAASVVLPNEFYLVQEILAADFGGASPVYNLAEVAVADTAADSLLGASLYTSSSRGGAESTNYAPPSHLHHARFRGFEFWGDVAEKEFFPTLLREDATDAEHLISAPTITSGSNTVTAVDIDGAQVGMLIGRTQSGVNRFPLGTYITAVSGTTLTMSAVATSSGSDAFYAFDTVFVRWGGGLTDRIAVGSPSRPAIDPMIWTSTPNVYSDFAEEYREGYEVSVRLGSKMRTARLGTARAWVSNPSAYAETTWSDLNTGTGSPSSGGTDALPALRRNGLAWSKFQEPETTALPYSVDVGGQAPITGLGALRDALIICKADGVYRLTGNNPERFNIQPLDTSIRILGAVQVLDNAVYALSDRGVVRITEASVERIDQNIVGDYWRGLSSNGVGRLSEILRYFVSDDQYLSPYVFAVADRYHGEYILSTEPLALASGLEAADETVLVYSTKTGAFTTWGPPGAVRLSAGATVSGDYASAVETYTPSVLLAHEDASGDATVVAADNAPTQLDDPQTQFAQDIRWRANFAGDPTRLKLWSAIVWDVRASSEDKIAVFQDGERGDDEELTITNGGKDEIRIWPPRAVARSTKLVAGLKGTDITVYSTRYSFVDSGGEAPIR